jgi:hypothetical protein
MMISLVFLKKQLESWINKQLIGSWGLRFWSVCAFYVINITTNNEEADKFIDCLSIVVGSELMLQLQDLTIDFVNHKITVPSVAPKRSQVSPNMCFRPK